MWTGIAAQPDGQYFGAHQYYRDADCSKIPERGHTAYRVLARADGARFLRVCFAKPEDAGIQPSIAPDGTPANDSDGCLDSDLVSPLPAGKPKIEAIATLPSQGKKRCLSRRS